MTPDCRGQAGTAGRPLASRCATGRPLALACAALLPETVFAACVFAPLGPYGEAGLDFTGGLSEAGHREVRLFFEARPQARENFRVDAAGQFEQMSVAADG